MFWWGMVALTLGLAYPWAQASLERFKIRNTFYGELQGHFVGSATRLFFRGFVFWLLVIGPLILGLMVAFGAVDWNALGEAYRRGPREMFNGAEGAGAATAAAFAALAVGWSLIAMAVLYPAFQAMVLRWWMSGLRFGAFTVTSHLRTGAVYGLYWRFVRVSLMFAIVPAIAAGAIYGIGSIEPRSEMKSASMQLAQTFLAIGTYVIAALAYSVIYQATVKLRLWKVSFESLALENVAVLDNVKAAPARASAVGEGIADALHVGGY
jgi:uncharacterized membrane protein YjgN (DUF898 family)